jgi:hypothetical protein
MKREKANPESNDKALTKREKGKALANDHGLSTSYHSSLLTTFQEHCAVLIKELRYSDKFNHYLKKSINRPTSTLNELEKAELTHAAHTAGNSLFGPFYLIQFRYFQLNSPIFQQIQVNCLARVGYLRDQSCP